MKKIRILTSTFFSLLIINSFAYATLQQDIDQLIKKVSPALRIGIQVVDLNTNTTLYSRNPEEAFIPASNMKLFSDAAALMALGPDYRFTNQLSATATQLKGGVLQGALYLTLPGDPSFTREHLKGLLSNLKDWKIKRIQGQFYIDSSHASINAYPPGWLEEDLIHSYAAPIAPVMIDMNRLTVTINPANQVGKPAWVETNDESGSLQINNQVVTKPKGQTCGIHIEMDEDNHLLLQGCVAAGQWAVQQEVAIRNPLLYAQGLIENQLKELDITLAHPAQLGKTPEGTLLLGNAYSKPVAQLMADTLKPSDNLYADSLFLHTAEKLNGSPVNWFEAQKLVKSFIQEQTGINLKQALLRDGSGLSRQDLLTPSQTVSLLRFLYNNFPITYEYIAALPVSGRDGTLQTRFKTSTEQDLIRAKTGSMKGIISLSGYLSAANAHTLAFAIFVNHTPEVKKSYMGQHRQLIDAICSYFLRHNLKNYAQKTVLPSRAAMKFQQKLAETDVEREKLARWRRLEGEIKALIDPEAVTVIYRNNELVLYDHQENEGKILEKLQPLRKRYPFAVILASKNAPTIKNDNLLWIHSPAREPSIQRIWTIREVKE